MKNRIVALIFGFYAFFVHAVETTLVNDAKPHWFQVASEPSNEDGINHVVVTPFASGDLRVRFVKGDGGSVVAEVSAIYAKETSGGDATVFKRKGGWILREGQSNPFQGDLETIVFKDFDLKVARIASNLQIGPEIDESIDDFQWEGEPPAYLCQSRVAQIVKPKSRSRKPGEI